jgi:NADPH:quinone reductase-like Zn-dependent oxidoreductase
LLSGNQIPLSSWIRADVPMELFHLRDWIRETPVDRVHQVYEFVLALTESGSLSTTIRARYPLDKITLALEDAQLPSPYGKVVLCHK